MLHENEFVMLLLSLGVAVFIILKRHSFRQFYGWRLLFGALFFFASGSVCTVLETFMFGTIFNHLEHICYLANALLILIWCISSITVRGDNNE